MQPRKRESSLTFEYLHQNKLLNSAETVIVKYDSTSRLSLCCSNIYISGLSGSICVDVPNSLFPHSWVSAPYLSGTSSTLSGSEF